MVNNLKALALTLILLGSPLGAGDIAQYVNLGFSEDSSVFAFAQFGIHHQSSLPYSDLFLVHVEDNAFLPQGTFSQTGSQVVSPFSDGREALFSLLRSTSDRLDESGIDSLHLGRPIYILFRDENYALNEAPEKTIRFRDRIEEVEYAITLNQESKKDAETVGTRFYLDIEANTGEGRDIEVSVGNKTRFRDGVSNYDIAQVILSPDAKSLICVIEKTMIEGDSISVRYMVETVRLF